jgi:hypothetical protein
MPKNTVYVGRPSMWGNPFTSGDQWAVDQFVNWLEKGPVSDAGIEMFAAKHAYIKANIHLLRGKNLACWCREGSPCHANILLNLANQEVGK